MRLVTRMTPAEPYCRQYNVLAAFGASVTEERSDPLLLGAEIELEYMNDDLKSDDYYEYSASGRGALNNVFAAQPRFLAKHDGSLDFGVELNTLPMSVEEHRQFAGVLFDESSAATVAAEDSCGIHVHVSRDAFVDDEHRKAFTGFFMRHAHGHMWRAFLDLLAGRRANSYCHRPDRADLMHRHGYWVSHDHFASVNHSSHGTYEVRIFASTTDPDTYTRRVSLIESVFELSKSGPIVAPSGLIESVVASRARWPELASFLESDVFAGYRPRMVEPGLLAELTGGVGLVEGLAVRYGAIEVCPGLMAAVG